MEEITNTSLVCVEPETLELSRDLSKEVRESIADVTRLVVEDISHNRHFGRKRDEAPAIRDLRRFLADNESTTPRKGQVPELSTQMQEKCNAKFPQEAPVSESLSSASDRQLLPATGTWPILTTNRSNMNRSLH
ncbi:MAG TPA: hypothetical protein VMY06_11185 [Sedimentisphaerales bacterium]|nr:hypothetical protein [Sedimentisphaerales bacterium]